MKKTAYLLLLILLAMLAGCNLFKPDDNDPDKGWLEIESLDFPVYVGHFGDYEHTDANGNHLGSVTYGEDGDDNDWQVFEYDAGNKPQASLKDISSNPDSAKDPEVPFYISVRANVTDYKSEPPASILLNGIPTGFTTPHTFTHYGIYDPALEEQYTVEFVDCTFYPAPTVEFQAETNTYTYWFYGEWDYIQPPWQDFTAILTEQGQVRVTWVTESETAMSGFRLYRSDNNDIAAAVEITPDIIPATNTSDMHTYSFTDSAVALGSTYYYWLELVYIEDGSTFHGPVSITLLPAENDVSYAYPNPCQDSFYLHIDVKLGSSATVLLLDSEHTIRKTYQLKGGSQQLQVDVSNLEPGLYRAFIWFSSQHYAYGDVLIEE